MTLYLCIIVYYTHYVPSRYIMYWANDRGTKIRVSRELNFITPNLYDQKK